MPELLEVLVRVLVVIAAFLVLPLLVGQVEHKAMAHMQARVGPMYAGAFHGWAQLVADGVKFVQKEDVVPAAADRMVFKIAPAVALLPYLVAMVAIPIGPGLVGQDLDLSLFLVLAVGSCAAEWAFAAGGIDKREARLYVFDNQARLQASSWVLLGAALGDDSVPGIGERKISSIRPEERTTPAGRFVAALDRNRAGEGTEYVEGLHCASPFLPGFTCTICGSSCSIPGARRMASAVRWMFFAEP